MQRRQEWVWSVADREGQGLEVGPLDRGIAPKRDGLDVKIMDYLDRESLLSRFEGSQRDTSKFEAVDFIFDGGPMHHVVGEERYDYIVCSHLVEHTPDLIGFLQGAEAALSERGVLCLIVPDMRYTFDHLDFPTTLSEIWRAHELKEPRPNHVTIYQHHANHAQMDGRNAWNENVNGTLAMTRTEQIALAHSDRAKNSDEYYDVHVWAFLPASLRLLARDLRRLGLITLTEVAFRETVGCEFFLALGKGYDARPYDRMDLLREARRQLRDGR